jgi:NAD(P)-dependent dehydrogenase (short-subunit alcohol dehydrogenase family)
MSSVFITGASSGIGRACAVKYSSEGHFVYILGRNKEELLKTQRMLKGSSQLLVCDLSRESEIDKMFSELDFLLNPPLEVLVNNAAIFKTGSFVEAKNLDSWQEQMNVNYFSVLYLTKKFIPIFISQKNGAIINISSTLSFKPSLGCSGYGASKAALDYWAQALALELAPYRIRVNCVNPGIVETPIHSFYHLDDEEKVKAIEKLNPLQPLGRIGRPEEIAEAVYFLSSKKSAWTTGSLWSVDGGIHLM